MKKQGKNIGVMGLWHLGSVYAACFASKGFDVTGFDFDQKIIENLDKNIPPIFEPDLRETLVKFKRNLHFTNAKKEFFKNKNYIFVTFDIPVDENDRLQMEIINKSFKLLAKYLNPQTVVVISSQIPIGTSRKLVNLLNKKFKPSVIYFPENLRLGQAFTSFLTADRIILGSDNKDSLSTFQKDFDFFRSPFVHMSLESAEMVKHALNTYLAACISLSSELSDLAEMSGANMSEVVNALKTDRRVSPFAPINPGLGFAGGTLGRDIQTLIKLSERKKYQPKLLKAIYSVNRDRVPMLFVKIKDILPNLKDKTIGILGLTYKPNTDTLRRSMSLELIDRLKGKSRIRAYDPVVKGKLPNYPFVEISQNITSFFKGLDMIILMTDWPEFKKIEPKLAANLVNHKIILDTKNFFDREKFVLAGFEVFRIGESR